MHLSEISLIEDAYAHSANGAGIKHDLATHLENVAETAFRFASAFDAENLAHLVGLLHDLGKAHPRFQKYLNGEGSSVDHKGVGAVIAETCLEPLALIIAGHHGGLRELAEVKASWLPEKHRAIDNDNSLRRIHDEFTFLNKQPYGLPAYLREELDAEFFLRMLFSALVDADFLDTEEHFVLSSFDSRGTRESLEVLWERLRLDQAKLSGHKIDHVNRIRHEVYEACLHAAKQPTGFFKLTVPTGGGKTRSGMAFALNHAIEHSLKRVIFAIPYTSIIEQTADVFRGIFGSEVVLEHHSAMVPDEQSDEIADGSSWSRLAAENWDAPIIVTTTVQLFESLFSNKTSKCRKLHNMSKSVIVLDEAQTLPSNLLKTILDGLNQLVTNYGTSIVFCTATQPAFERSPELVSLPDIKEIAPDTTRLFAALKRVKYEWPLGDETWSWSQVAEEMLSAEQALAIVNTKKDALALLTELNEPDVFHLSTLLCGAHRREVLNEVRYRLSTGKPCRLVSTQVVEAGVDIDFPLVLRAIGPFDRIVQAAGRCNREGRLPLGRVIVFNPDGGSSPPGAYRTGSDTTLRIMRQPGFDFDDPACSESYFKLFFQAVEHDTGRIQELRKRFNYPEVAARFRLIEDDSVLIFVSYSGLDGQQKTADRILSEIKRSPELSRRLIRHAQPYLVSVRQREIEQYIRDGLAHEIKPGSGFYVWMGSYNVVRGLETDSLDPDQLVI